MESLGYDELLKKCKLTKTAIRKGVSGEHLEVISRSHCKEWKRLPSHLGLEAIVASDIDKSLAEEGDKRHNFLLKWKQIKGCAATYEQLIKALLKVKSGEDAERVCSLLKNSKSHPLSSDAAPKDPVLARSQSLASASNHEGMSTSGDSEARCPNSRCRWKGSVSMLEKHSATCKHAPIPCPKNCKKKGTSDTTGDTNHILRKDMDKHLKDDCPNRDHECEYCEEKDTYANILVHQKTCKKKKDPCPQCGKPIQCQGMKRHLEATCVEGEVACKYKKLGCDKKIKRNEIKEHEDTAVQSHLQMVLKKTTTMDSDIVTMDKDSLHMEAKISTIEDKVDYSASSKKELFTFKVMDKGEPSTISSFDTGQNGHHVSISVYPKGRAGDPDSSEHVSAYLVLFQTGECDQKPFVGDIKVTLLNQLSDSKHFKLSPSITIEQDKQIHSYRNFISHSALANDPDENTQYLKDDLLYFRVSVDKHWLACNATCI